LSDARHQQCLNHLLWQSNAMATTATRGAVCFPHWVAELLPTDMDLRDRHAEGSSAGTPSPWPVAAWRTNCPT
jgi:hypothetical protein